MAGVSFNQLLRPKVAEASFNQLFGAQMAGVSFNQHEDRFPFEFEKVFVICETKGFSRFN